MNTPELPIPFTLKPCPFCGHPPIDCDTFVQCELCNVAAAKAVWANRQPPRDNATSDRGLAKADALYCLQHALDQASGTTSARNASAVYNYLRMQGVNLVKDDSDMGVARAGESPRRSLTAKLEAAMICEPGNPDEHVINNTLRHAIAIAGEHEATCKESLQVGVQSEISDIDDLRNYIMPLLTSLIGDELDAIHFKKQTGFECNPIAHKLAQAIIARNKPKPMSVDLDDVAMWKEHRKRQESNISHYEYRKILKQALDAAGVKHD